MESWLRPSHMLEPVWIKPTKHLGIWIERMMSTCKIHHSRTWMNSAEDLLLSQTDYQGCIEYGEKQT
eukprot:2153730-Prorocentrum_lima.AAC.1